MPRLGGRGDAHCSNQEAPMSPGEDVSARISGKGGVFLRITGKPMIPKVQKGTRFCSLFYK